MSDATPPARPKILVVVRHPAVRGTTWGELTKAGCELEFVTDEFDALSLVESRGPEFKVAVVDGDFRHFTGAEIADRVSHLSPRTRVIVCTDRAAVLSRKTSIGRIAMSSVPAHLVETVQKAIARAAEVEGRAGRP